MQFQTSHTFTYGDVMQTRAIVLQILSWHLMFTHGGEYRHIIPDFFLPPPPHTCCVCLCNSFLAKRCFPLLVFVNLCESVASIMIVVVFQAFLPLGQCCCYHFFVYSAQIVCAVFSVSHCRYGVFFLFSSLSCLFDLVEVTY